MRRAALAAMVFAAGAVHAAQGDERVTAPLQLFAPPAPGTYALPPILAAPDGRVLDGRGRGRSLREFTTGRVTLLSFVYTQCTDSSGCPLALDTLARVRERLAREPGLARQARLVSLSFDPEYDRPEVMRLFEKSFAAGRAGPPWHFLTTASARELAPVLEGFGQDAAVNLEGDPRRARRIDHMLRVFLLDRRARVREIYSSAYLMPDVIVNDMLTLMAEADSRAPSSRPSP